MVPGPDEGPWTRERVEAKLLEALRPRPGVTIIRSAGIVRALDSNHDAIVEPLNWTARFVTESRERRVLQTWLRCRSEVMAGAGLDASFSEACRAWGWNPSTAEIVRRRAAARIATGLNAERQELDNCKTTIRPSASPAQKPSLIKA